MCVVCTILYRIYVCNTGDIINHGKYESWGKPGTHYHQGMGAGENTLNAQCARIVMRTVTEEGGK